MIILNQNQNNVIITRFDNHLTLTGSFLFEFQQNEATTKLNYNLQKSESLNNYQSFNLNLSGSNDFNPGWYNYTISQVSSSATTSSLDIIQELEQGKCFVSGSSTAVTIIKNTKSNITRK